MPVVLTTASQRPPRWSIAEQDTMLLLSLAYLGPLTLEQLAQLTTIHERSVRRRLTQDTTSLKNRGLIARHEQGDFDTATGTPQRGGAVWALRDPGKQEIARHAQYPRHTLARDAQYPARRAVPRGESVARHDALVVATTIDLLVTARQQRPGLAGIFVRLEHKLSPFQTAPWSDALLAVHWAVPQPDQHPLPWTRNLPLQGQDHHNLLLEVDRGTEPGGTIAGKAQEYRRAWEEPRWQTWWREQYGSLPHILWVVPDATRRALVQRCWVEAWPQGRWYLATVADAQANTWQRWEHGTLTTVQLFAPPPPTPAAAAPPPAPTTPPSPAPAVATAAAAEPTQAAPAAIVPAASLGATRSGTSAQLTRKQPVLTSVAPLRRAALPPWKQVRWAFWELAEIVSAAGSWAVDGVMTRQGGLLPGMVLLLTSLLLGVAACYVLVVVALLWLLCGTLEALWYRVWRDARVVRADGTVNPQLLSVLARILLVLLLCGLLPLATWRLVSVIDLARARQPATIIVVQ